MLCGLGLPENVGALKTADNDSGLVKLDHQINKDNRLTLRYNIEDARNLNVLMGDTLDGGGIGAPSSAHNNFLRDQALVGTLSSQLKSEPDQHRTRASMPAATPPSQEPPASRTWTFPTRS